MEEGIVTIDGISTIAMMEIDIDIDLICDCVQALLKLTLSMIVWITKLYNWFEMHKRICLVYATINIRIIVQEDNSIAKTMRVKLHSDIQ